MFQFSKPLFLICETPLHAGSGSDLGIIDLPIQRERHTSFPKIESSSFKGALREAFEGNVNARNFAQWNDDDVKIHRVFGFDDGSLDSRTKERLKNRFKYKPNPDKDEEKEGNDFAGCIGFTDARLLLFPVKSMKGVFVWVTCPQVLNRLEADLKVTNQTISNIESIKNQTIKAGSALVADKNAVAFGEHIVLEEYAFSATQNKDVKQFAVDLANTLFKGDDLAYWNTTLKNNLVVLNNDDFRDFVNQSTEVITRIKINNETGTVDKATGGLFTEEYLPNDSVMYNLVLFSNEFTQNTQKMTATDVFKFFDEQLKSIKMFQLGGSATLGKGLLRTQLLNNSK
jgi:CRISPR-associated protein Cmr4